MADTVENTPEPTAEQEAILEAVEQVVTAPEPIKKPKAKTTKKTAAPPPPKPAPVVEEDNGVNEEEEEAPPTLVIHKRHKKSKPRKIIVITDDDSEPNTDDEEMPYRRRQEVTVKGKPKEIKPVKLVNEKKQKAFVPVIEEEEEEEEAPAPAPAKKTPVRVSNPKPAAKPSFKPPKVGDEGRIVGERPNPALTRAYMSQGQQIEAVRKQQSVTGDPWLDNLFGLK